MNSLFASFRQWHNAHVFLVIIDYSMFIIINRLIFIRNYLQIASTKLADTLNPGGKGAKNSLLLYLVMINRSLSS